MKVFFLITLALNVLAIGSFPVLERKDGGFIVTFLALGIAAIANIAFVVTLIARWLVS